MATFFLATERVPVPPGAASNLAENEFDLQRFFEDRSFHEAVPSKIAAPS
jgi:hypothetical protein